MMSDKRFQKKLDRLRKKGKRYKREKEIRDTYAKYAPEKRERKVSNIMLVVAVTAITIYTIASFWLTYVSGIAVDATLTTCFYTFWGGELFALAGLKVSKIIKGYGMDSITEIISDDYTDDNNACG